jgi:hypothetical protein
MDPSRSSMKERGLLTDDTLSTDLVMSNLGPKVAMAEQGITPLQTRRRRPLRLERC